MAPSVRIRASAAAGCLCVLALLARRPDVAQAAASVAISITPSTLSWTNVNDFTNQFLAPSGGPIAVTGTMKSGTGNGAHALTIGVTSPAKVLGSVTGNAIPISAFSITCAGMGNSAAPVYAAANTTLVASSATTCATWAPAKSTTITLNFTINVFLDDRTFPADTYTAVGFNVVGSAS